MKPTRADLVAGFSVALVLIPQSLAYAQLAGLPAHLGLLASTIPLIIFSLFASSPYLQTGPVALTGLLTISTLQFSGYEPQTDTYIKAAALLACLLGILRILIALCKLSWVVYIICKPVMQGFTTAAAIIILSSQLPKALGAEQHAPDGKTLNKAIWTLTHPEQWQWQAISLTIATVAFMYGGKRIHKLFPGVLIATIIALLLAQFDLYTGSLVGNPNPIPTELPTFTIDLPWKETFSLLPGAIMIAIIGFAEPSAIARTFANEDKTSWNAKQEFTASGISNIAAAFTGTFPVGGSFSRSALNRFSGAETRWSGSITGISVLCFLPFAAILNNIPQALLGGIVLGAALKLIKPKSLYLLWKASPTQFVLAAVTFFATLFFAPNIQWALLGGVFGTIIHHFVFKLSFQEEISETTAILTPTGLLWRYSEKKFYDTIRSFSEEHREKNITINVQNMADIEYETIQMIDQIAVDTGAQNFRTDGVAQ